MATKRPTLKQGMKPAGGADRAAEVARDLAASLRSASPAPAEKVESGPAKTLVVGVRLSPELHDLLSAVASKRTAKARTLGLGPVSASALIRSLLEKAAEELRGELEG